MTLLVRELFPVPRLRVPMLRLFPARFIVAGEAAVELFATRKEPIETLLSKVIVGVFVIYTISDVVDGADVAGLDVSVITVYAVLPVPCSVIFTVFQLVTVSHLPSPAVPVQIYVSPHTPCATNKNTSASTRRRSLKRDNFIEDLDTFWVII